jgi:hypothetical protein
MFDSNDREIIEQSIKTIKDRHSLQEENFNPYDNPQKAQKKCKHMWNNGTDAIYFGANGKRICAICKKVF